MILIMDGFGLGADDDTNAIYLAKTPNLDQLAEEYPYTQIEASGTRVGLPEGQMGNSEVGHLNMGAGRVINQSLLKINMDIANDTMKDNPILDEAMNQAQGKTLHILGLLSPGGVHSHEDHIYKILQIAKSKGLHQVYLHLFFDGRDVAPDSAIDSVDLLEERMAATRLGMIATIAGRYYAMDRDNNWERTEKVYNAIMNAKGPKIGNVKDYLKDQYQEGIYDEFIEPGVVGAYEGIEEGDVIIFANFRPDRARQLTQALSQDDFEGFEREDHKETYFVTLTEYDSDFKGIHVVYEYEIPENTLGEHISKKGLKQLRIAETEKYAHVTFFFNGGVEDEFEGEERILVPSPKVPTFDMQPEMSAEGIADKVIEEIAKEKFDLIVLNFANCDMVGHTGKMEETIKAVETVDTQVQRVCDALKEHGGQAIITADHGNAEIMRDEEGNIVTSHSTSPVPLILFTENKDVKLREGGALGNIAPTILDMMGISKPEEMLEESLIERGE